MSQELFQELKQAVIDGIPERAIKAAEKVSTLPWP